MNFRKLLFIWSILLMVSCSKDKDKTIRALGYQINTKDRDIDALKSKNKDLKIKLNGCYELNKNQETRHEEEQEIKLKKMDSIRMFSMEIIMDQKNLFSYCFKNLITYSSGVQDNIHMMEYNKHDSKISITDIEYLAYLGKHMDRSTKTIERLFSEENKQHIYNLFAYTSYYKTTGLQNVVDALLVTHEELKNNETLRLEIQQLATDPEFDENYSEQMKRFKKAVSADILRILQIEYYNEDDPFVPSRARWVYTFWIRRQMEGTSDLIVELLREFKQNLEN